MEAKNLRVDTPAKRHDEALLTKAGPADMTRWQRLQRRHDAAHTRKVNRRYRKRLRQQASAKAVIEAQLAILEGRVEVPAAVFNNVRQAVTARLVREGKIKVEDGQVVYIDEAAEFAKTGARYPSRGWPKDAGSARAAAVAATQEEAQVA